MLVNGRTHVVAMLSTLVNLNKLIYFGEQSMHNLIFVDITFWYVVHLQIAIWRASTIP